MNLVESVLENLNRKKYFFAIVAFILPFIFYFSVFSGRSFGLECAQGLMGVEPPYQQTKTLNNKYCNDISDVGAFAWAHYPQWVKTASLYSSLQLPLWNQNNGIGLPLAANFISTAYFIPNIIFALPNNVLSFDLYFILRMSFVSLGMYLFLRSFKFPKILALTGSLLVFLNGYLTFTPTISHHNVDIFIPWVALLINKSFFSKEIRYFVLLALIFALSTLGGMPESSIFIALFYFFYTAFISFFVARKHRIKTFVLFSLVFILSIALSSILIIPGLEYIANSVNAHSPGSQPTSIPFLYIIPWVFPRIFGLYQGIKDYTLQIGGPAWFFGNYIGTFFSFFLLSSGILILTSWKSIKSQEYHRFYVFFFFFVTFLIAQYFALIPNILAHLPGFTQTLYTKYSLSIINFAAATTAIFTINYLINSKKQSVLFYTTLLLLFGIVLVYALLRGQAIRLGTKNYEVLVLQLLLSVSVIASIIFVLTQNFIRSNQIKFAFLFIICSIELFLYIPFVVDLKRRDSFRPAPFVKFLQTNIAQNESRIFSPDYLMYPDLSAIFNINDIRNLDALWPANYFTYLDQFVSKDFKNSNFRFSGIKEDTSNGYTDMTSVYFNLLSVKYILTYRNIDDYIKLKILYPYLYQITETPMLSTTFFTINGETKPVLFEHAPGTVTFNVEKPSNSNYLYLYPSMSEKVFNDKTNSDGVVFIATAKSNNSILFEQKVEMNPKLNKEDQKWFEIKLGPFSDDVKTFQLTLKTDSITNNINDWSGWGGFQWDSQFVDNSSRYKKVYDKELKIFENGNFIPRIRPIAKVICRKDKNSVLEEMKYLNSALVADSVNFGTNCKNQSFLTNVAIKKQIFNDSKVTFTYSAPEDAYAILSNLYYPGWKLRINGKELTIDEANYTFQGLKLPKGTDMKVEVSYEPFSFQLGAFISITSLFISVFLLFRFKGKKLNI